jgi:hypothetical protein
MPCHQGSVQVGNVHVVVGAPACWLGGAAYLYTIYHASFTFQKKRGVHWPHFPNEARNSLAGHNHKRDICTGRGSCSEAVGSSSVGPESAVLGGMRNRYTSVCSTKNELVTFLFGGLLPILPSPKYACHRTDAELAVAASLCAYMAYPCLHLTK